MTMFSDHRLKGLESDNLLAFMALLGMLRSLEEFKPDWCPRVYWDVDKFPVRAVLNVVGGVKEVDVVTAIAEGLRRCANLHDFGGYRNLKELKPADATRKLRDVARDFESTLQDIHKTSGEIKKPHEASGKRYVADLWASLMSDAVCRNEEEMEPTPFCLMFGQGHEYFLERLVSVPQMLLPPPRREGRTRIEISETDCLREALFEGWKRPDLKPAAPSFRWDPHEDVRYALRARNPSGDKKTTQHGANRLAAVGFSALTVFPKQRAGNLRLEVLGGSRDRKGNFIFTWPIWRHPASLASIRGLLSHPNLSDPETCKVLGIVECRRVRRISAGKYMNFTQATRPDFERQSEIH